MTFSILDIPDDHEAKKTWLTDWLVRPGLGGFVAETRMLLGEHIAPNVNEETIDEKWAERLSEVCGAQLPRMCSEGLGALSETQIDELVRKPELLLAAQEHLIQYGGPHWDAQFDSSMTSIDTKQHWRSIEAEIDESRGNRTHTVMPQDHVPAKRSSRRAFAVIVMAASMLVGVTLWQFSQPTTSGWGFARSGLLTANVSSAEYFESLADASGDWFNKRPTNSTELAARLRQFSKGCQELIDAPHAQLAQTDRDWLVGKCGVWKDKIDSLETQVRTNELGFEDSMSNADTTMRNLQSALKERAKLS